MFEISSSYFCADYRVDFTNSGTLQMQAVRLCLRLLNSEVLTLHEKSDFFADWLNSPPGPLS